VACSVGDMATELGYELAAPIRRITVDDYHRIGEAGVFDRDEHVELLDGMLIEMAPIGHRHGYAARTVANLLGYALGRRAIIETNAPLALTPDSEPLPDVLVLRPPFTLYRERLPRPADVILLIEIAETSRAYDRGPKARSYAEAGIEELWVVDLVEEEVVVFREPGAGGFESRTVARRGDRVTPARFPDVTLAVSEFLESAAPTR
jgi:Uma2 family endonuclease